MHREFTNHYPAKLVIEHDRIITENGNKPYICGNINPDNNTPYPKNPTIARFFKEIGWAEELGSGVRKIAKYAKIYAGANLWTVFIWGVPISCVIAIVFNRFWGNSKVALYLISILIWTFLAAVYLQFMDYSLWVIFILGVPAEVLTILWYGLRKQTAKMKSNQK